jgi:methylenetetrahydrofolate--tRNA-(uracil-5-)-methyltransferase
VLRFGLPSASDLPPSVVVIGGGLAGCEAAWQVAQRGLRVRLFEMRPARMTQAHRTDRLAELVCSNSLGSNLPNRALGLLKNELRRLGSLIIASADSTCLPAGDALAVGRDAFSLAVTSAVQAHPLIEVLREEMPTILEDCTTVVATGPLTSVSLAEEIRRLAGEDHLHFFDAMAPIVARDSIDMGVAFRASRWARRPPETAGPEPEAQSGDYINCPLTRDEYYSFVEAVTHAEKAPLRDSEQQDDACGYFERCLPVEVLAARSPDALAFGPMRPVGLRDPRTGHRPFAAVQLRQDNLVGTLYNIVGFQTNLRWEDQERVLRMIPGLQRAEFVRLGQMHRNTFINSPVLLRSTMQWHSRDDLLFAGQLTGTEGYVGSIAGGLLAGLNAARIARQRSPVTLPTTTMIGALMHYITHADPGTFQPMKANFGLLPDLGSGISDKQARHNAYAERALCDLEMTIRSAELLFDNTAFAVVGCRL